MDSKTVIPKQDRQNQKWFLIDAEGKVLGRLASRVATILRGKDNPLFTPHLDMGAYVVIINAERIRLTGMKYSQKKYYSYTGYPGGLKEKKLSTVMDKYPERILQKAVKGMLPRNKLGSRLLRKLYIYAGGDHPHAAQKPEKIDF